MSLCLPLAYLEQWFDKRKGTANRESEEPLLPEEEVPALLRCWEFFVVSHFVAHAGGAKGCPKRVARHSPVDVPHSV